MDVDVDPLRTTAAGILEGLAGQFLSAPNMSANGVTAKDLVMKSLQSDPELVRELISDPSVVQMFMDATEGDAIDPMEEAPEVPDSPPEPPSPMPE